VSDIDERRIEAGHQFPDPADKNVAYSEVCLCTLLMNLDKSIVVEQRDLDACRARADNQLFIHDVRLIESKTATKGG